MVAPVPNLTRLAGTLRARRPHPRLAGWESVTLAVESAEPVPGAADLLTRRVPGDVEVAVRSGVLGSAGAGSRVTCQVKLTPDGLMVPGGPGVFRVG